MINDYVSTYKHFIFKLSVPTDKHTDTTVIQKGLQVIARGLEQKPDLFNADYLQVLFNIVHHHSQPVKEEVANIILIHS